jgi:UDP-2,3-diacylglucosamine pyrophosphatase LpxH
MPTMDAIIVSDLHLGSDNCQAKQLTQFLESLLEGNPVAHRLILNGDVFDSIDFRRLKKHHWKVLSLLRKLSDRLEVVWINGNHDGAAEIVSHLLGVSVVEEYVLLSGGKKHLILHGHRFDSFIDNHPILTAIGDFIYHVLQRIDRTHSIARMAKQQSKTFLRCVQQIHDRAVEYARKHGCAVVCCGHTHQAKIDTSSDVTYCNSGCWTELPCSYLTVAEGVTTLHRFVPAAEPVADVTLARIPA